MTKTALVTGANRGIGFEVCRQLARKGLMVVLTSRDPEKGRKAVESLVHEGLEVMFHPLDVTRDESVGEVVRFVREKLGRLDVLVNNAGVLLDGSHATLPPIERMRATMETNVYGPYRLCEAFAPQMRMHRYGRIVNVSSGMGQLSEMNGGYPAYRISKASLNVLTRIFSDEFADDNVLVNSVCPGWVMTDMGGAGAERTPEQGADTIVWAATLPDGGPSGGFFRDRERIPW